MRIHFNQDDGQWLCTPWTALVGFVVAVRPQGQHKQQYLRSTEYTISTLIVHGYTTINGMCNFARDVPAGVTCT